MAKGSRAANNTGASYRRPDGRWELKVSLPDGRRKSFYGKKQSEAQKAYKDWLEEQRQGLDDASTALTVGAFLDDWLEGTAKERVRDSTYVSYSSHIAVHVKPSLGAVMLRDLSPRQVNAMLKHIVDGGTSASTANLVRATLRTALASALKWGYVTRNVAALAEPRKQVRRRIAPLTVEQAREFMVGVQKDRLGMLYLTAIYTGARQGELLGLRWSDVDLEKGVITITHILTWPNGKPEFTDPKTDQSQRTIGLGPSAISALKEQQRRNAQAETLAARRWEEWHLVFPNTIGKPLNGTNVTHRLQVKLEELGLPRQRFHDLRHLAATIHLSEGADLHSVKELLGHSQISLTANTYGHLTEKLRSVAAIRMDQAIGLTLVDDNSDDSFDDKHDGTELDGVA